MTILTSKTKRGQALIARAQNIEGRDLSDVYGRYSEAKSSAYLRCLVLSVLEDGTEFGIVSHNTFGFSVAWRVADGWRLETPQNSYHILEVK